MNSVSRVLRGCLAVAAVAALAGILCGCGGAGVSGPGPTRQTRERVLGIHQSSLRSLGFSGFGAPGFLGIWGGPAAQGGVGGGEPASGGVPMLGAFVRSLATGQGRSRDGGSTGGGGGEPPEPLPDFYFDDYLGLWVAVQETPTSYSLLFYQDEARQLPAGSMLSEWPEEWGTFPQTYRTVYEFLAGSLQGAHGVFECLSESESAGHMTYENTWQDGSHDQGTSEWSDQSYLWTSRWDGSDGSWYTDSGEFLSDGTGRTSSEDSFGYRLTYVYHADGSGEGRIEGPDPGLPAVVTWDAEGNMRIRYADGTVQTFPGYGWVECGEGTAGSGSGGGGEPGG